MEAQLIGATVPQDPDNSSAIEQATNAGLVGALMVHTFAG